MILEFIVYIAYNTLSLNNTIFFIFVLVLKLLKMAKGIRALLDTVMQALPQVGNLGLLFFLLFFIFAALGVEMFGRLGNKNISILRISYHLIILKTSQTCIWLI